MTVLNVNGGVSLLIEHFTVVVLVTVSRWNVLFFLSVLICCRMVLICCLLCFLFLCRSCS
jgi:hypothetical protein